MLLSRLAAMKSMLATTVGALTCAAPYGVAYEQHHIEVTNASLPVPALPPALESMRIGVLTDIYHSRLAQL